MQRAFFSAHGGPRAAPLPFLFFAEHRWDIVQLLAIYRFSPFNSRGGTPLGSNCRSMNARSMNALPQQIN
jgi:hypothetical protein